MSRRCVMYLMDHIVCQHRHPASYQSTVVCLVIAMMETTNFSHGRSLAFRGFARVGLDTLQFRHDSHRGLDNRNVTRLCKIFELEGCQRLDDHHFVDVIIDEASFDSIQDGTNEPVVQTQPARDWLSAPLLDIGSIECLSGRHRIQAALQYLEPNDRWWIARVYSDGKETSNSQTHLLTMARPFSIESNQPFGELS